MHGSSSVRQEWPIIIRLFGGDIKEPYGPLDQNAGQYRYAKVVAKRLHFGTLRCR
jgi:hypothetical protein